MKICNVCGSELDDTCFGTTKGKNGELYLRGTCKDCLNSKRRNKTTNKTTTKPPTIIKSENKIIEKKVNMINTNFTDKEILEVVLNKDNRIHTVFNLDKDIRDKIKALANDKKLNLSDVANLIFKKYFR